MKTYKIQIFTPIGPVWVDYSEAQDLKEFEQELLNKYGTFVTIQSIEQTTKP